MSAQPSKTDFTYWTAAMFFIPLALQAIGQCLTYPLVAAVVSAHPDDGVVQLASMAQGHMLMFIFNAIGFGLVTTGMIFARDRVGAARFRQMNFLILGAVCIAQLSICIPGLSQLAFEQILGLTPEMAHIARNTLLIGLVAQITFFCRNIPLTQLLNARRTVQANIATVARLAFTLLLVPIFLRIGWTGYVAGNVAFTIPLFLEYGLSHWFARDLIKNLPEPITPPATIWQQLEFTLPLSLGGILMASSMFLLSAFISRTPDMRIMLPIHTIAMGIVNPVCQGALRMQAVAIAFPPLNRHDHSTIKFALLAGLGLAVWPLLLSQVPFLSSWYFGTIQHLESTSIPLAATAVLIITVLPILQALRGRTEGIAALQKRPAAILAGQAMYLGALAMALFIQWTLDVPGYRMGVQAIIFAVFMAWITVRISLLRAEQEQPLEPHEQDPVQA